MSHKILLVEDERKTAELLKRALELEKIEVVWSMNGQDALKEIQTVRFDLIVLDLKMPGMTGDEVLENIRMLDPYVEVIIYTNYQEPPMMKKLINLGVDGYINKGSDANLWDAVEQIKRKLDPLTLEEIEDLRELLPENLFKDKNSSNGDK